MADIRYYDVILKPVVTEKSMDIKKAIVTLTENSKEIEVFAGL